MLLAEARTPLEANQPMELKIPYTCSHSPVCAASCHCFKGQGRNKKAYHQKNHPINFYLNFQRQSKKSWYSKTKECDPISRARLRFNPVLSACAALAVAVISHQHGSPSQEFHRSQNKSDVLPNIQRQKRLHCSTKWLKIAIIMNYLGYFQACIHVKVRKSLRRWFRE